jgi:hypothetical protein
MPAEVDEPSWIEATAAPHQDRARQRHLVVAVVVDALAAVRCGAMAEASRWRRFTGIARGLRAQG